MSVDKDDWIHKERKNGKQDKLYAHYCESCGVKKGYFAKNIKAKLCNSCSMKNKIQHMSIDFKRNKAKNAVSFRKITKRSEDTKKKISKANKNKIRSMETRIYLSCLKQEIPLEQWTDFEYNKEDPKRSKYKSDKFCLQVYIKANYTCDLCGKYGGKFNAHHLNNWKQFINQRYDLDNIICLCINCHRSFHKKFGTRNNTKEQYLEFKENYHGCKLDVTVS